MAHSKPYRDMEGRPKAIEKDDYKGSTAMIDDKLLIRFNKWCLRSIYQFYSDAEKKIERMNKQKLLLKRRKAMREKQKIKN